MKPEENIIKNNAVPPRPLKPYEIFILWLAALAVWEQIFSSQFFPLPNAQDLTYPSAALTAIWLIKRNQRLKQLSLSDFFGKNLPRTAVFTIFALTPFAVAIGVGCWALLVLIEANINPDRTYRVWNLMTRSDFNNTEWSYWWLLVNLVCAAIVAPIAEEIAFRGLILRSLQENHSTPVAIVSTSLLFATFHINKSFPSSFALSVVFSVLAIRLSSLYAPILAHGLYNLAVTTLRLSTGLSLVAEKNSFASLRYWLPELVSLVIALLSCLIYAICIHSKHKPAPNAIP